MIHGRADYNARIQDSANLIPDAEPVFLLRGQDRTAARTLRYWADQNEGLNPVQAAAARAHATLMEAWPVKKTADAPAEPPLGVEDD